MSIITKFINRFKKSGERSKKSFINIILSFGAKGISIITQLLIVPLTINYVNPTQYGIWLTLSSIVAWIGFFDLGFGSGMRNKVAEAKAKGDVELAKRYVSTTYFAIGTIVVVLFLTVELLNNFLSWSSILKVDDVYNEELRKVFAILTAFFCLSMVVKLFNSLLNADQKPGVVSLINVFGQLISLIVIYLLTKYSEGSLLRLATFYSGIPALTLLFISAIAYHFTPYRQYAPHYKYVKKGLIKDIVNVGVQFFIIYLSMLVIFQVINIVISRELGPESVTEYNIAYKYFNIAYSVIVIILSPFWSAFTDAYYKKDFVWMKKAKAMLEKIWICEIVAMILMVVIAPWFYKVWIGGSAQVRTIVSIWMSVYIIVQSLGTIYMHLINGIGCIRIQLVVYLIFAIISWPLMMYSCRAFGLVGILFSPTLVYVVQSILGKIQIEKLLNGKAVGIWAK